MPKVSIIVPVYKAEKYLNRCIDSILAQTFTDWELLLIDDGSPDRSGDICDEYAKKDTRIRVFHKKNGGVSSARNAGLDVAKGQWVVFVDSDDWCEENYLCDFINTQNILHEECVVLQGRMNEVDEKVVDNLVLKECSYENVSEAMLENNLLTFGAPYCKLYSNILIQKNRIRFPEEYSYGEDDCIFPKVTTWLRAFMDAEMTIIDSFHRIVFSIIFNKPFWVIGNTNRGLGRFTSLLKFFHLESRLLDVDHLYENDFSQTINWKNVNSILEGKREECNLLLLNQFNDKYGKS